MRKKKPIAPWVSTLLIGIVFVVCLCCFISSLFYSNEDPYVKGLEEVLHTATSMRVVHGKTFDSASVLIEDLEQVQAAAQLILDSMDGNRTFAPSYAAGGEVYGFFFYCNDQFLYSVVIYPEVAGVMKHVLPDHTNLSNSQETKIRRGNSQFYASTNRGAVIQLWAELLP